MRASFEFGRDPERDDGLRQIEPDDRLRAWIQRVEPRRFDPAAPRPIATPLKPLPPTTRTPPCE